MAWVLTALTSVVEEHEMVPLKPFRPAGVMPGKLPSGGKGCTVMSAEKSLPSGPLA
jgi:hypothetical protein